MSKSKIVIPEAAVEAAKIAVEREMRDRTYDRDVCDDALFREGVADIARAALEAAAHHIIAQALRDAVEAVPLETITAPDSAVVWLRRRAGQIQI